ncbi:MAG: histidine phosphatase family protein [Candidatus Micrarchaeota archaeon]|nr:histidine phosphatase family protein [Candidatus Micrarchaeota archaeon]
MAKTIIMVRHGESESNEKKYFAGWYDSPLTPLGQEQAQVLRKRISHEKIGRAYCSDLLRARQTLQALSLKCPAEYATELREKNYGSLEGVSWAADDGTLAPHHFDPLIRAPGGENVEEMQSRVVEYFERKILCAKEDEVLVVAHHGPLVAFTCHLLGMPLMKERALRLGNCGLSILKFDDGMWRLSLWNSLSHAGLENFSPLYKEKHGAP